MVRAVRRLISAGCLICALAASTAVSGDKTTTTIPQIYQAQNDQVAQRIIEVRLRRLHLVRPDLIPYPIAYEIVC